MINYYGATDVGNARTNNEDTFHISEACHYCLVADGMGGAAAGEVASRIFADTARSVFDGHDAKSVSDSLARVQATFKRANENMLRYVARNPNARGMGCTAELLAFSEDRVIIGHVGDSRTYRFRSHTLKLLTKDHSLVQEQIDQGLISSQEARRHAMRNVILKAIGVNDTIAFDLMKGRRLPEDLFLLCSDGLTDMIDESDVSAILKGDGTLREKTHALIQLAKASGGKDNITVVLSAVSG